MPPNSALASSDAGPNTGSYYPEDLEEEEPTLPMYRCINPRDIIRPEQIDLNAIADKHKENNIGKEHGIDSIPHPVSKSELPSPKYPLTLMWNPAVINFELHYDRVVNRLRIFNSCIRPIYIQIYGLWNQEARLGASWCCRPRTRILLAPGMISYLVIIATPRDESPIPEARIGLQLSATHMRDIVVGYFYVPIKVKFLNFKTIDCMEESMPDLNQTVVNTSGNGNTGSKGTVLVVSDIDGSTFNK